MVDPWQSEHADLLEALDEHDRLARLPRVTRVVGRVARLGFATVGMSIVAFLLLALAFGWGKGEVVFEVMAMLVAAVREPVEARRSDNGVFAVRPV